MSNVNSLIDSGLDAFTNLYDIIFTFPTGIENKGSTNALASPNLSVRTQDFTFPTLTVEKYPVAYKAVVLNRIKPKIIGDRKFTFSFRVDNNWNIYTKLKAWKKLYMDEYSNSSYTTGVNIDFTKLGSLSTDNNINFGTVKVIAFNSNTNMNAVDDYNDTVNTAPMWEFKQVICKNVVEPTFTRDSAEPLVIQAEFIFGTYIPAGEA